MIAFWNRAEVYVGPSEQDFMRMRNRLDEAGIRHTYRIANNNVGLGMDSRGATLYYIYVHRKDAEAAGVRI